MHPLETYLRDLSEIHGSGAGVKETSSYPVLAALLNDLGKTLKPKVRCIIHLRSQGAGIPDGGLFTADQLRGLDEGDDPLEGQLPARAVLEVKGAGADVDKVAKGAQVAKYLGKYGLVLVTNYRAFRLVKAGAGGRPEMLEAYRLGRDGARLLDPGGASPPGRPSTRRTFGRLSPAGHACQCAADHARGGGLVPRLVRPRRARPR